MVSEVVRTARKFCLGGRLFFFFNSLGDDAKQVFSFFVDTDGINYGKKVWYLDTCHSYFYDGCCEQRGIGG